MESNDNRNFLIFLAIVFVTAVVALIVVLAISWRWISEPVEYFFGSIARFQELQTLNYNFDIPDADPSQVISQGSVDENSEEQSEDGEPIPAPVYNYIFNIPTRAFDRNQYRVEDSILQDAKSLGYFSQTNDLSEVEYNIQIPKIGFNSSVISGLGEEDILKKGMWVIPDSGDERLGEIVTLCYSKFFFPSDKRSCEFLEQLELDDKIYVTDSQNNTYIYAIYDVDEVPVGTESIYFVNDPEQEENIIPGLRIISTKPETSESERLAIYAEQIEQL